jgi:hypothetical protein
MPKSRAVLGNGRELDGWWHHSRDDHALALALSGKDFLEEVRGMLALNEDAAMFLALVLIVGARAPFKKLSPERVAIVQQILMEELKERMTMS